MIGFLYGQTEYNILKSAMRLEDYVNKAKLYGYKSYRLLIIICMVTINFIIYVLKMVLSP